MNLNLESYFDHLAPDDIRIKGTRIGIESVLYEYVHRGQAAEAIAAHFPTLSLEQVYATILWYLRDRERLDPYLADWLAASHAAREAQERNPPPIVLKLRQLKAARLAPAPQRRRLF
ncbi:DUF433 domain-containing protein [Candidatus Chloroploca sp. M-50]|uniref:DUF433 domain-containing protein n=1 Tax=Candidatus Chloroploca mongolica TaxID=2528176 RepID=A0ABS4DHK4_9CHLR|nr:DUF433 domain-containing protein [Candidatus Chloroploca mongolica]MBP1468924.1 DUF433 domain-containing protein [Candidatus Chloroploca mongolica]